MIKTLLILFGVLQIGHPQTSSFATLSQNFCTILSGGALPDNLSCPNVPVEMGQCFVRSELCDGSNDCADGTTGSDEGDNLLWNKLECKI